MADAMANGSGPTFREIERSEWQHPVLGRAIAIRQHGGKVLGLLLFCIFLTALGPLVIVHSSDPSWSSRYSSDVLRLAGLGDTVLGALGAITMLRTSRRPFGLVVGERGIELPSRRLMMWAEIARIEPSGLPFARNIAVTPVDFAAWTAAQRLSRLDRLGMLVDCGPGVVTIESQNLSVGVGRTVALMAEAHRHATRSLDDAGLAPAPYLVDPRE